VLKQNLPKMLCDLCVETDLRTNSGHDVSSPGRVIRMLQG
jgi:hypothetical protein